MNKYSNLVAAIPLLGALSMAYAGSLPGGNTVRTNDAPSRGANARISTLVLPSPRIAAMTLVPKAIPLDQPRSLKPPQESTIPAPVTERSADDRSPIAFGIAWRAQPSLINPEIVHNARNFRRSGLPIVNLWQSDKNLVALGLSPRGVPGVYFTQRISNAGSPP